MNVMGFWWNFAEELERKALYWEELEKNIAGDLNTLTERVSWDVKSLLINDLETKFSYAETQWLKVDKLKDQFIDFRVTMFKRDIDKKIDEIREKWNYFNTKISAIEAEYRKLQNIDWVDYQELKGLMENLDLEIKKWKLLLKVKDVRDSGWTSVYSLEEIEKEYYSLKDKWIDVEEIEEILFDL